MTRIDNGIRQVWKFKKDQVDAWVESGGAAGPVETDKKRKE